MILHGNIWTPSPKRMLCRWWPVLCVDVWPCQGRLYKQVMKRLAAQPCSRQTAMICETKLERRRNKFKGVEAWNIRIDAPELNKNKTEIKIRCSPPVFWNRNLGVDFGPNDFTHIELDAQCDGAKPSQHHLYLGEHRGAKPFGGLGTREKRRRSSKKTTKHSRFCSTGFKEIRLFPANIVKCTAPTCQTLRFLIPQCWTLGLS